MLQAPLFAEPYCGDCITREICHAQHTEMSCTELGPVHPSVLHITSPDFQSRFLEVNGFTFNVKAQVQMTTSLPAYIPVIKPREWASERTLPYVEAIAVPLNEVQDLARRSFRHGVSARRLLGLESGQRLIVSGFAHDRFLEKHWPASRRRTLLHTIRQLEPDAVMAWNYSVWHRHSSGWAYPRIEQLYNLKRSLKVFGEMQQLGISAIPHTYWGHHDDLKRWVSWILENSSGHALSGSPDVGPKYSLGSCA